MNRMIKIIAVSVLMTAFCSLSHAWDNNIVHPGLTNKAVDFLLAKDPANFDELKNVSHFNIEDHRGKQLTFLDEGSVKEDYGFTPLCESDCSAPSWNIKQFGEKQDEIVQSLAWKGHAYNPVTEKTFFNADGFGIDNAVKHAETIWTDLNKDTVTNKYFHIGRISHLIEDMTSPAHAHAVSHVFGEDVESFGESNYDKTVFSVSVARRPSDSGHDTMKKDNVGNFMKNVARNTYDMTGYLGKTLVKEVGDVQPDSELKRMFPSNINHNPDLRYDTGGWTDWAGWIIDDVGKYYPHWVTQVFQGFEGLKWWECDSDPGYYYLRHTAVAKPKVFKKDKFKRIQSGDDLNAALESNATAKTLTAIYTENLFPMAAEWVAGFIAFAYEVENRLRLIYPNGGEYFQHADTVDVRWNYNTTETAIKTVTLEILKDNTVLFTKTDLNPATAFRLDIYRDMPNVKSSTTYQIRIIGKAADGGEVARDMSSAFSIYNYDDLTIPIPSISPPSGTYFPGQSVSIRKAFETMDIRYTTDGTTPTDRNGKDYSVPFTISEPVTIKAIATYGVQKSAVAEAVYTIKLRAPAITYTSGLVVKDVTLTSIAGASIRYATIDVPIATYLDLGEWIADLIKYGKFVRFFPPTFALLDDPTTSTGTMYTAPFGVTKTTIVKAIAYKDGFTTSDVGDYEVVLKSSQVPVADYDGDGLSDTEELETYHTDPTKKDTDGDGASDGDEIQNKTDPNKADAPGYDSTPKPGVIDVGSANVNASVSKTLSVSETGNAELKVRSNEITGTNAADFIVSPATLTIADGGAAQNLSIKCTPSAEGARTATLKVNHNAAGTPATYTLNCTGNKAAAPVYYEPSYYEPPVNQAPVADILYVSTEMNKAISVKLTGIDPGSDFFTLLMKPLTYSVVTQPKSGTLTGTAPALIYTPNPGFVGTDSFTYRVYDGTAYSASAAVSVIVHQNSHANIGDKYEMDIFCAEYDGAKYGFRLNLTPVAADPSAYYWKGDLLTFGKAYSDSSGKGCIPVGKDLHLNVPTAVYRGTVYQFTLNYTPVSGDAFGFYWKMDLSTLKTQ